MPHSQNEICKRQFNKLMNQALQESGLGWTLFKNVSLDECRAFASGLLKRTQMEMVKKTQLAYAEQPIECLALPERTCRRFKEAGFTTVGALLTADPRSIRLQIPRRPAQCWNQMVERLTDAGIPHSFSHMNR